MLKKRYNTFTTIIVMAIIAACVFGALYLIRHHYGFDVGYNIAIFVFVGIMLTIYTLSLTKWRDAIIVDQPSNYPPQGYDPIQTGCIIDGKVNDRDIVAAFFYLGVKGYVKYTEYELQRYKITAIKYPQDENDELKRLFSAIFGNEICSLIISSDYTNELDIDRVTVNLSDAAPRLIEIIPGICERTFNKLSKKKNKEIADLTGKVRGFRQSIIDNKGDVVDSLVASDENYLFEIIPYAYQFAVTAKVSSNFNNVNVKSPSWYLPHGVDLDYNFDILVYNSMLRNLPEELNRLVFENIAIRQKVGM